MRLWLTLAIVCGVLFAQRVPAMAQASSPSAATPAGAYAAVPDWIQTTLATSSADFKHARIPWAVGIFTGNMYKDPLQAEAMRRVFSVWLNRMTARGDTVVVAGFEHSVWTVSKPIRLQSGVADLQRVFDALPGHPQSGSRGGKNIELSMAELADKWPDRTAVRPVILMLANGFSQDAIPSDEDFKRTQRLEQEGYQISKQVFQIFVHSVPEHVYAFLAVPKNLAAAREAQERVPLAGATEWVPAAYAPSEQANERATRLFTERRGAQRPSGNWAGVLAAAFLGATAGGVGIALARSRRGREDQSMQTSLLRHVVEMAQDLSRRLEAEIQAIKDVGIKLAGSLSAPAQSAPQVPPSVMQLGELRNQIAVLESEIRDWDDTAMDFLDAVQRALAMDGIAPERKDVWARAGNILIRRAQRNGFDVIRPNPGEPFLVGLHDVANGARPGAGEFIVQRCIRWGYRRGNHVYRPAEVEVAPAQSVEED